MMTEFQKNVKSQVRPKFSSLQISVQFHNIRTLQRLKSSKATAIKHTKTYIHCAPKNDIVHLSYSNHFDFHFHAHKEQSLFSMTSQTFIATQSWVLHAMPGTHKSLHFNLWGNCPRDGESFPGLAWQRRVRAESRGEIWFISAGLE